MGTGGCVYTSSPTCSQQCALIRTSVWDCAKDRAGAGSGAVSGGGSGGAALSRDSAGITLEGTSGHLLRAEHF